MIYGPKQLSLAMTPFFFVLLQFFSFSFLGSSSASILLPAVGHDRHMYTPLATPCYSATVSSGSRECAVADSPGAVQHRREKKTLLPYLADAWIHLTHAHAASAYHHGKNKDYLTGEKKTRTHYIFSYLFSAKKGFKSSV